MRKQLMIIGVCLLSIVSFFSGCINIPEELTQFSIMSFDVEPRVINQGEFANLSWVVLSASSINIDNGIGNVALTGHRIIQPMQTTTYILTASNTTITKSATVTVIVNHNSNESNETNESPEYQEIIISSFDVYPDGGINLGGSAYLSWVVIGATTVSIDNGVGHVPLSGNRIIWPTQTTTYTLTASKGNTSKTATVIIYVTSSPEPPNQTPNIACTTDSTRNVITVATADADIKWVDVIITTNPVINWRLYYNGGITAALDNSYPMNTITVLAGDYILLVGSSLGNVRTTLRYLPTNSLLGTWTVNV